MISSVSSQKSQLGKGCRMPDLNCVTAGKPEGRFSRFELIAWWNQERLARARVLVVGAGALGNEIIKNLCLVGVGNLLVADMDSIENSNLSRSVLYREVDDGRPKAEVACERARDIYPGIKAQAFYGNIVHDLGLGVYLWADAILGGLDNREARVAINSGAAFARKHWIDGAIEVLDGVARVFHPEEGACYECTMSDIDWKILESRRSCALLTREKMMAGHVPTTPTTSSIVAAIQVQEAIKLLHGMPVIAGRGVHYAGVPCEFTEVIYPRKPECYGHDTYETLRNTGLTTRGTTVRDVMEMAKDDLGADAVVGLSRDIIQALECPACGERREVFASLGKVKESEALCAQCGAMCVPDTLMTLDLDHELNDKTLGELGVPLYDVLTARNSNRTVSYVFDGDAPLVLGAVEGD